jgi:glycosyltransferase involved in cell wall biosynthesis
LRVTVLASSNPDFSHSGANELVLGAVIEGLVFAGHEVSWATAGAAAPVSEKARMRLHDLRVAFAGDFTTHLDFKVPCSVAIKRARLFRQALTSGDEDDVPVFRNPEQVVDRLANGKPDMLLLFWDTWFEHLIPYLRGFRVAGFLAKPRYDAPEIRLRNGLLGARMRNPVRRWVAARTIAHQKARHYARMKQIDFIANICAMDAANYRSCGLHAEYLPLPVPDFFPGGAGMRWERQTDQEIGIIGAMGSLTPLGSSIGAVYLSREILPRLDKILNDQWRIHIYGRGDFPLEARALDEHHKVLKHGFVEDIDSEMLRRPLFLFLNNAGPYTGTYTRVTYALSSGICMIAHSNLARSVPELSSGDNILMGSNPEQIAAHVAEAVRSPDLRRRIGESARATYLRFFSPKAVGTRLGELIASHVNSS